MEYMNTIFNKYLLYLNVKGPSFESGKRVCLFSFLSKSKERERERERNNDSFIYLFIYFDCSSFLSSPILDNKKNQVPNLAK
jgi:dolichol kinase